MYLQTLSSLLQYHQLTLLLEREKVPQELILQRSQYVLYVLKFKINQNV